MSPLTQMAPLKDSMEDAQGALDLALDGMADAIRIAPGLKPFLSPYMKTIQGIVLELPKWKEFMELPRENRRCDIP